MSAFSPLIHRITAAREGTTSAPSVVRDALARRLAEALRVELPELEDLEWSTPEASPWEIVMRGRVPGLEPVERGVGALAAWAAVATGGSEWHAAWTDGPVLTLDAVLRAPEGDVLHSTAARVVLDPG